MCTGGNWGFGIKKKKEIGLVEQPVITIMWLMWGALLGEMMMMMIWRVHRVDQKTIYFLEPDTHHIFLVFPVSLSLIACRDTEFQDTEKGNLVILGIESQSLCLFCAENGGTPTLQLKVSNCSWWGRYTR